MSARGRRRNRRIAAGIRAASKPRRTRWKRAKVPAAKRDRDRGKLGAQRYTQIARVVDGAVADCIRHHREYFTTNQAVADARRSIVKRVTGSIIGYLEQSRRGASGATDPGA